MKKKKSSSNFFDRLLQTFQAESEQLGKVLKTTQIHDNKPDIGREREDALLEFIRRHLPLSCSIGRGGFIYDLEGDRSKQIDLLITNDRTLQFRTTFDNKSVSFSCIEGCLAAISVKSKLTKKELIDSIENLRSIPTEQNFRISPLITNPDEVVSQMPQRIIFAYDGINFESLRKNLDEYIKQKSLSIKERPDLIIVNNSYFFAKIPPGGANDIFTNESLTPGIYTANSLKEMNDIGGAALLNLLTRIQNLVLLSSYFDVDYQLYLNKIMRFTHRF